jgi:hypothetical protein
MNTNLYTQNQNVIIMKVLGAYEISKISTIGTPATSLSFLGNKERQSMAQLWASQSQGTSRVAIVKNKHISSKHRPILFFTRDQNPNNAHDS